MVTKNFHVSILNSLFAKNFFNKKVLLRIYIWNGFNLTCNPSGCHLDNSKHHPFDNYEKLLDYLTISFFSPTHLHNVNM
jgi:hypothetical protein